MTLLEQIQQRQRDNEERFLQLIRMRGVYDPFLLSTPMRNAQKRLEAAGRIRWDRKRGGCVEVQ